jgi:class 3 adenylate cyclase
MEPQIQYCTTADGVSIAYYVMGEGSPLVVTSALLWSDLRIQHFEEYHRSSSGKGLGRGLQLIRYDARGAGLSDRYPLDFSMDARLLDIEAVVERLKLTRFALFGVNNGAPTAIAYAAGHPERVSHLILGGAYARGRDHREVSRDFDSMRERADEQWEHYTLAVANANLDFNDSEAAQKLAALYRESMTPESLRAFYDTQESIDVTELLPQVASPTLVVYRAGAGHPARLAWSRELASKIPDARFVVTGQTATLWSQEETRIIEDFLEVSEEAPSPDRSGAPPSHGRKASASRTILYTDIEGNTGMLQRLGDDAWRAVLRDHERITRDLLRAHRGTEVKTLGDGFMASFDSATSAVECAIDLQRTFATRNHTAAETMLVRVGLNAGEPIEEDDDLFGTAVTMAARIMGEGAGGEILVSGVVRELVAGKGFTFADRGEFVPKGFDDPVRLYDVRWRE